MKCNCCERKLPFGGPIAEDGALSLENESSEEHSRKRRSHMAVQSISEDGHGTFFHRQRSAQSGIRAGEVAAFNHPDTNMWLLWPCATF